MKTETATKITKTTVFSPEEVLEILKNHIANNIDPEWNHAHGHFVINSTEDPYGGPDRFHVGRIEFNLTSESTNDNPKTENT